VNENEDFNETNNHTSDSAITSSAFKFYVSNRIITAPKRTSTIASAHMPSKEHLLARKLVYSDVKDTKMLLKKPPEIFENLMKNSLNLLETDIKADTYSLTGLIREAGKQSAHQYFVKNNMKFSIL